MFIVYVHSIVQFTRFILFLFCRRLECTCVLCISLGPYFKQDVQYLTFFILVDILGLLKWASNKENLENSLIKLINIVNAEEVVKYLQDILDALFNILVQNDDPAKFDNLVFKCLLRLIETVSDMKYQHFQSVLDLYINEIFFATLAYE